MKRSQVVASLVLSLAVAGLSGGAAQAIAAPTTPGNFQAAVASSSSEVSLTWTVSSAPVGIKGYQIERSLDQVTWQPVVSGLQSTSYSDMTAAFGVH